MKDCVFCKIIAGKIPSEKVYENDKIYVFLDIMPVNPGHTLVIPKEHYKNIEDLPEDLLCEMSKVVKKVGKAIKNGLGAKGYNIALNNGTVAGQVVSHVHFHVIPRKLNDGLKLWPQRQYQNKEAREVAEMLIKTIK